MILGIDHLAYNITDLEQAAADLVGRGFTQVFCETQLLNHPNKKPLLREYHDEHDIAFFTRDTQVPIELTRHGASQHNATPPYDYQPDHIILTTPNLQQEKAFWCNQLGFKSTGEDNRISFRSPIPQWSCTLALHEDHAINPCMLDDHGYTCLALLSNHLERDIETAKQGGATDISDIFPHQVNGKKMNITLFRTPGGAMVELIKV